MANTVTGAIDAAVGTGYQTRPLPRSIGAQARYLLGREKGNYTAAAKRVGVSPRTFRGWTKSKDIHARITPRSTTALRRETSLEWQPGLRRKAVEQLRGQGPGATVEMRGEFGYSGVPDGTTDEARNRRITVHLPPFWAGRLLATYAAGQHGSPKLETDLRVVLGEAIKEEYFQDSRRRAQSLTKVDINDIDYIDLEFS